MSYWKQKIAVVTGGSDGLGRHLAEAFARDGARVVIAARNPERLQATADDLRQRGLDVTPMVADVTDQPQVERLFDQIRDRHGRLDVLVNNAGRSARGRLLDTTPEQFQDLIDVNFMSVVRCTRAAMPLLLESRGHLVNIGSLACKTATRYLGAYPCSKHPVAAYSQQLRRELYHDGVHVLLVCPGPLARSSPRERPSDELAGIPAAATGPAGGAKIRAIDPVSLAQRVLNDCRRRRAELIVPARARWLFAISQLWPDWGDAIVRRVTPS